MTCLLLISALFLITACDNGDELSTDQMTDTGITVKAFGPSPALRGGELRFVGTNVDRATAVVIPGVPEITEFTKKENGDTRDYSADCTGGLCDTAYPSGRYHAENNAHLFRTYCH